MFRHILLAMTILVMGTSIASAQNLEGHWFGKISVHHSKFPLLFIFKTEPQSNLTGEIVTPLGLRELSKCRIKGDSLFFIDKFGSNILYHYAKIYTDSIKMKMKGLWGKNDYYYFTVYRRKELKNASIKADSMFVRKQYH